MVIKIGDQFKRGHLHQELITIIKIDPAYLPMISYFNENNENNRSYVHTIDIHIIRNLIKKNYWVVAQDGLDKLGDLLQTLYMRRLRYFFLRFLRGVPEEKYISLLEEDDKLIMNTWALTQALSMENFTLRQEIDRLHNILS